MKLLIASENKNKIAEISKLLEGKNWEIFSMGDFPTVEMPPEDADTFVGNARIKAAAGVAATGFWTIADDSGLEVDFLGGEPGVYSARYAGEHKNDDDNNQKLLAAIADCPDEKRTARFIAALVLLGADGEEFSAVGKCEGYIAREFKGDSGFGYDPLFVLADKFDGETKTMAELTMAEKNTVSHRSKALAELKNIFDQIVE